MTVHHPDPAPHVLARGPVTGEDIEAVRRTLDHVRRDLELRRRAGSARRDRDDADRRMARFARGQLTRRP